MIKLVLKTDIAGRKVVLERIRSRSVALDGELMSQVAAIIKDVRQRGDAALLDYAARFDGIELSSGDLRVDEGVLRESARRADPRVVGALREAISNVRAFHERQIEKSWQFTPKTGVTLGQRIAPIERVGVYVPGGSAAYPSSVVMNLVPAQLAGVTRIVVATPPRTVTGNAAVAAALVELNATEVYAVGGAQAIAALAFGTETVPRVDKITGPGNKYVAAAKKLVFGTVGIDSIAGPTEVVIVADETARADFVAADLLAQAEHGEDASAVLITTSESLARDVVDEIVRQVEKLPRRRIVETSLAEYGAILLVAELEEACAIVNDLAPEHLEIIVRDEDALAARIKHAGAIFFGSYTPEAVGDYFAGPNHILPTGGTARFSSALGLYDFTRRTSLLRYSQKALGLSAEKIAAIAQAEGLDAHARSALIRSGDGPEVRLSRLELDQVPKDETRDRKHEVGGAVSRIKPQVRELRAYALRTDRASVKINQNENPWEAPARIKEETLRRLDLRKWSRYPEFAPVKLRERLAESTGWKADGLLTGNGSNELIQAVLMVTVGAGRRVLISEPTFALYRQITTILGGEVVSVPMASDLRYDVDAIRAAIDETQPDVTIICSPNNPTGCSISDVDLASLLEVTDGLVVVDEAYHEFAEHSVAPLLNDHENLIVLRTFSKAMAMAGLRIGYLLAAPSLAQEISKAVLPYNLNVISETAAEVAVVEYEAELRPLVRTIIEERESLFRELGRIDGLEPAPSRANFMVVRSAIEPRKVFDELLQRGILIRDVSGYPMLDDYFRVSVGTPEENHLLCAALREICGAKC